EDLVTFPGGAEASRQIKTLVYMTKNPGGTDRPLLLLLRGDHQLNETKLTDLGIGEIRPAQPDEIRGILHASPGSLGPVAAREKARDATWEGVNSKVIKFPEITIFADSALQNRRNMTTGANEDDWHIRGVDTERDFKVDQWFDFRTVQSGEGCPRCETGTLEVFKGMEIGHIFKLGTKYSDSMGATVLNQDGKEVPIVMGSYGIGVERIIAAAVEQGHDADGIIWPRALTPFDVIVTITNIKQDDLRETGEKLYHDLQHAGLEVLLDDRDERAGVKFKDADLIGVPYRITIGKKAAEGIVELFDRRAKQSEDVKISDVVTHVQRLALASS
ncbi:MAG TPA: His/Gly/Thr/Pro-type tRNA ligase C-terminal domain-containing protein, partial [Pyrinomonadaceae bacterium]|nr:His/Gly/Thr/Pro-type tRNA ligase C-terminal domain-containing protein [Pyrinomonadaceae bacterium]